MLGGLSAEEWERPYGRRWTVADVPRHLLVFYRGVTLDALERGANAPCDSRGEWRTMAELQASNDVLLAALPPSRSPAEGYAEMRAALLALRDALARIGDADLDRPVWWPVLAGRGWRTARYAWEATIAHTWAHATEVRLRLGKQQPEPPEGATRRALGVFVHQVSGLLDRDRSALSGLTTTLELAGPGGAWTLYAADGSCQVREGRLGQPDLVLALSPETLVRCFLASMRSPAVAWLRGDLQVSSLRNLATFRRLFPYSPHRVWAPHAYGAAVPLSR